MHLEKERFVTDKTYAFGWVMYCSLFVLTLLSLFLMAKVVTEVIAWTNGGGEGYPANTINVIGEGEIIAVPDVAQFTFSVSTIAETVEAAQADVTVKSNAAIAYLESEGVAESDIKTTNYSAYPRYDYGVCRGFDCVNEQRLIGYEVSETFTVTVRDTAQAGTLLAGVGREGVTNISGLSFTIDDPLLLQESARSEAIKHAREQADRLADDLGVKLKRVVSFSEDQGSYYPEYQMARGMGGDMAPDMATSRLPVGENTVRSKVYITYEIR